LGSVGEPATIADRVAFWGQLHRRLEGLSNRIGQDGQANIIGAVHARIPMVTVDDQRILQRENAEADAKFWEGLQGMNAGLAEGHKDVAAKSARIAAAATHGLQMDAPLPRTIKAKVIFVSGYAEDAFSKNLPEGEDFGFLPKPFSLKQLIEAVKGKQ
jgi:hypothetical protein